MQAEGQLGNGVEVKDCRLARCHLAVVICLPFTCQVFFWQEKNLFANKGLQWFFSKVEFAAPLIRPVLADIGGVLHAPAGQYLRPFD